MSKNDNKFFFKNDELIALAEKSYELGDSLLGCFNSKEMKLMDLSPHKRIYLFFLTRAIKTYRAILNLCVEGYGQDVSTLLRSLLDNLISVKYILSDIELADEKAIRFVEFKWVIFRRYIVNKSKENLDLSSEVQNNLINKKYDGFKKKYDITSNKGLLTWSGRAVVDMARLVDKNLLDEYQSIFRSCSRFSHPSIVGDSEYLNYEEKILTFSHLPSLAGISANLEKATDYLIDFINIFNEMFNLGYHDDIMNVKSKLNKIRDDKKEKNDSNPASTDLQIKSAKDVLVKFLRKK